MADATSHEKPESEMTPEERFRTLIRTQASRGDAHRTAEAYKARKAKPHPLYQSSSAAYGAVPKGYKQVGKQERHIRKGAFTKVRTCRVRAVPHANQHAGVSECCHVP